MPAATTLPSGLSAAVATGSFPVSVATSDWPPTFHVLVFGAASDYALLLIHRYREELQHHPTTEAAMATALRSTLPTLVASGGR